MIKAGLMKGKTLSSPLSFCILLLVTTFMLSVVAMAAMPLLKQKRQAVYTIKSVSSAKSEETPRGLDLNTATRQELMTIKGVGEKTADAIIALREENGRIGYLEDLMSIHGIGEAKVEALREYVYIQP